MGKDFACIFAFLMGVMKMPVMERCRIKYCRRCERSDVTSLQMEPLRLSG